MRYAVVALLLTLVPTVALAKDIIECRRKGKEPIRIVFDAEMFEGRKLSCLEGNFIADITPCAPNGGFSLSRPTGLATIAAVVDRWQDTMDHLGGVTGFFASDTTITFTGSFVGNSSHELWSFDVDRVTGIGKLKLEGKAAGDHVCKRVKPKV